MSRSLLFDSAPAPGRRGSSILAWRRWELVR
uniref:Lox9 n=1 Tax=Arundo donax TaxID=35708 RepID=A0A0A9E1C6_ARUDO